MKRQMNKYRILSFTQALRETQNEKEFLNIGPTPHNDDCTEAGGNTADSIFECSLYVRQLIRFYGTPPEGCEYFIIRNVHEFGTYYDVNIFYKIANEQANTDQLLFQQNEDYALKVECGLDCWDDEAKMELTEGEHHLHVAKIVNIKKSA